MTSHYWVRPASLAAVLIVFASVSALWSPTPAFAAGTAPTAIPSQEPTANNAGWNKTAVTVTWNWSDADDDLDPANCTLTSQSSGEGSQQLNATCSDLAGNQGSASHQVKVDTVVPTIEGAVSPPANGVGWRKSNLTISFNCADITSGVAACGPQQTLTTEGAGQSVVGLAVDFAGNEQTVTVSGLNLDKTAPETNFTSQPPSVSILPTATLSFAGSDALSGVASFECSLDNGPFAACTSPKIYSGLANGQHTLQVRAIDVAGNSDASPATYTWAVELAAPITVCWGYPVYQQVGGIFVALGWNGRVLVGTPGRDTLRGTSAAELIVGLGGPDKIESPGGADVICGGEGDDWLVGAAGNQWLAGEGGADKLTGGPGFHDHLDGGAGNDTLSDPDGVASAQGGGDDDSLTLAFKKGWTNPTGQPQLAGLTAGYGNDKVNIAVAGRTPLWFELSGDELNGPASPHEGNADRLSLRGPSDSASTIVKFEVQYVQSADAEVDLPTIIAEWQAAGDWVADEETNELLFMPVVGR